MRKIKFIFTSQDLDDVGIAESQINDIGIIVTALSFSKFGNEKSYNFMHKTVQEFCAAWHISKAFSSKDQLSCITSHWHDIKYRMVWLFYSGITGLSSSEVLDSMLPYKQMSSSLTKRTVRHLVECVFEAQSEQVCKTVGDYLEGHLVDLSSSWVANSYFLMHYKGKIRSINADNLNNMMFEKLIHSLKYNHDESLTLTFSSYGISFPLLICLADLQYPITELCISGMQLGSVENAGGKAVPLCNNLLKLFITKNCTTRKVANFSVTMGGLHSPDLSKSHLNFFNMHMCQLNPAAISKIHNILQDISSLTVIDLSCNSISDLEVERIANCFNKIQQLSLCNNNITVVGVHYLTKMMKTLVSLDLSQNPLKDEGVHLILSSIMASISHIGLLSVEMTSSSYHIIANALHKVNSICFDLPASADCKIICENLTTTTVLSYIQVKIEDLPTNGCFLSAVSQNVHIKGLTLHYGVRNIKVANNINTWLEGLINLLEHTKTLTELAIVNCDDENYLSDDMLILADFVKQNKSIKLLNYNDFMCTDTALKFLELLADAYTLEDVILRVCVDPICDYNQDLATVEKCVKRINKFRKQKGVSTLLHVTIEVDDFAFFCL